MTRITRPTTVGGNIVAESAGYGIVFRDTYTLADAAKALEEAEKQGDQEKAAAIRADIVSYANEYLNEDPHL